MTNQTSSFKSCQVKKFKSKTVLITSLKPRTMLDSCHFNFRKCVLNKKRESANSSVISGIGPAFCFLMIKLTRLLCGRQFLDQRYAHLFYLQKVIEQNNINCKERLQ